MSTETAERIPTLSSLLLQKDYVFPATIARLIHLIKWLEVSITAAKAEIDRPGLLKASSPQFRVNTKRHQTLVKAAV